jgi:hypothetical protein
MKWKEKKTERQRKGCFKRGKNIVMGLFCYTANEQKWKIQKTKERERERERERGSACEPLTW